ncbi:MAG TPA: glycosyltransferase family 4 protein [Vicinamibacterales bacterium]|nr:glycosyltransferase family 4 protein [Vicinamibacterales bacterium]
MKLACVVHRFGADIAGGSEAHCRHVAEHLAAEHDVTILTSCARDHISWRNEYAPGTTTLGPLTVVRYPTARQRSLHRFADISELAFSGSASDADQEDWFRENGPDLPGLLAHLDRHGRDYDAVLFWAFRYAEVYFGLPHVQDRAILVPTAEEDPVIRMSVLHRFFVRPAGCIFLTPEEQDLVERRMSGAPPPSTIIGSGLDLPRPGTIDLGTLGVEPPFILYLGRIDPNKGCADLLQHFIRFKADDGGRARLVMAGPASMPLPLHDDIRYLGFVDEPTRDALLQQAHLLAMPSRFESLSLALLEAWNHSLPALVNGHCAVLKGQALRANGALYYRNYDEFARALSVLLGQPEVARTLGAQGRAYVDREYRWPTVIAKINALLARVVGGPVA